MKSTFPWPKRIKKRNAIMNINSFAWSLSLAPLYWYLEVSTKDHFVTYIFQGFCAIWETMYIQLSLFLTLRHFPQRPVQQDIWIICLVKKSKRSNAKVAENHKTILQIPTKSLAAPLPHLFGEALTREMCRKYFSRREKIFPNSQIDVFPPFPVH